MWTFVSSSTRQVDPGVSLAEFYVVGYRQRFELEELTSGNYSRLCADILFSRSMGYYIIQVGHVLPRVTCHCHVSPPRRCTCPAA